MNVSDFILEERVKHSINLLRIESGYRKQARDILLQMQQEIVERLSFIDPTAVTRIKFREQRLIELLSDVNRIIRDNYFLLNKTQQREFRQLAEFEIDNEFKTTKAAIGFDIKSLVVDGELLNAVAKDNLILGAPLKEWWGRQSKVMQQSFADQMRLGLLQGESLGDLVKRVRGIHTGSFTTVTLVDGTKRRYGNFSGGLMDLTTRKAEALVRTSSQSVLNEVRQKSMEEYEDLIKGYYANAVLDGRTTSFCKAHSGQAWDTEGNPLEGTVLPYPGIPPWHVNCRTNLVPIMKSFNDLREEAGKRRLKVLDGLPKRTQAAMDGQVAKELNYESWLKTKSKGFQIDALGKGKWELWNSGKLTSFTQLIDQTGRELTLADLKLKLAK